MKRYRASLGHKVTQTLLFVISFGFYLPLPIHAQSLDDLDLKEKPSMTGSIGANLGTNYNSRSNVSVSSPLYSLTLQSTFKAYGISMPISFMYAQGTQQTSLPSFMRLGISPTFKKIRFHLGHRSISYNPFVVQAWAIFGAGMEWKPGKFVLNMMGGRLQQSHAFDASHPLYGKVAPRYRRIGYTLKTGWNGTNSHFLITGLYAKDVVNSLSDTLSRLPDPQTNTALSADVKIGITKGFNLFALCSGSVLTRKQNFISLDSLLDSSGDGKLPEFVKSIMPHVNASSQMLTAYQAGAQFQSRSFGLRAAYKVIGNDYRTLAIPYIQAGFSNLTIEPSFTLFKDKLHWQSVIGLQKSIEQSTKLSSNSNTIFQSSLQIQPSPKMNLSLLYSNFGFTISGTNDDIVDSISYQSIQSQLAGHFVYQLTSATGLLNQLTFTFSNQTTHEENEFHPFAGNDLSSIQLGAQYSLTNQDIKLTIGGGANYFMHKLFNELLPEVGTQMKTYGVTTFLHKRFGDEERVGVGTNIGVQFNSRLDDHTIGYNASANISYKWTPKMTITLQGRYFDSTSLYGKTQQHQFSTSLQYIL